MLKRLFLSCFILGAFTSCNTTERKYDSLGIMERENNFVFSLQYKTFLLDSANWVIYVDFIAK